MYRIRIARDDDAAALAMLMEQTYRATFSATNTPHDMEVHCRRHYGEARQRAEIHAGDIATYVCVSGEALIAYMQLRWGNAPACVEAPAAIEINRLYVVAAWHGQGVAAQLFATALEHAREHGVERLWLGVWEHNERAQAFYRKCGFVVVGEHVFLMGEDPQRDLLMRRDGHTLDGPIDTAGPSAARVT